MLLFMNTDKNITTGKLVIDVAYFRRVWFVTYGATPRHTSRAAGVAAESAAAA